MIDLLTNAIANFPFEWAQFSFMQYGFLSILVLSPLFALLGSMVIGNQMSFFSDAVGHAGLTGIAIGTILGLVEPLRAMILFALLLAFAVTILRRYAALSGDTVIGILMAGSVALGIVILSINGGFAKYSRYLIGDILSITKNDLLTLFVTAVFVIIGWTFLYNRMLILSVNQSLARSRGTPVWPLSFVSSALVAVVVTISLQWVGILVTNALLIIPAATARNLASSAKNYILLSVICSTIAGIAGLLLSFYISTATGATIVLCTLILFIVSIFIRIFR